MQSDQADQTQDTLATKESGSVTVVVATRDRPELLRDALRAIRGQDFPGVVKTIVVFDQSTPDKTLETLDPQRPVQVLVNTRSPGLAGARNTGLTAAESTFVAFCDDDDVWKPSHLTAQVDALERNPTAILSTCGIEINFAGAKTTRVLHRDFVTLQDLVRSRLTECHPSTFVFRRAELLDHVGVVSEEIPGSYAEDYELLLRVARAQPIRNLREALVEVRWHPQSFFTARWRTIADALTWLLLRYPEFQSDRRGHSRVLGQIAFARAAGDQRGSAAAAVWRTLITYPLEPRAVLSVAVLLRLVTPPQVLAFLNRRGKSV